MSDNNDINELITVPKFNDSKFLPFEGAFDDYNVIVFGKTDTAIRWAEKFLQNGFVTAVQFDEIPDVLKPYRFNIQYQQDDINKWFWSGEDVIVAIATGDSEQDQSVASILHEEGIRLIMSETPSRYTTIRFPEDKTEVKPQSNENNEIVDKPIIKLGIFEDELNTRLTVATLKELKENFPDFQFEKVVLKPYEPDKFNLKNNSITHSAKETVNQDFDRGYNSLYKDDVDLIIVDAEAVPNFRMPDIDFWPTLMERSSNYVISLSPKDKKLTNMRNWPDNQKVFYDNYVFRDEINSLMDSYNEERDEEIFPELINFENYKDLKKLYEENPDAVVVTSFNKYQEKGFNVFNYEDYNLEMGITPLAPIPLAGLKVGISRKDNQSEALKMLKTAAEKINQDQTQMFIYENYYRNRLKPLYYKFVGCNFSGGFRKSLDNKYSFDGYAEEDHGKFIKCGGNEYETMEGAALEMLLFIYKAYVLW